MDWKNSTIPDAAIIKYRPNIILRALGFKYKDGQSSYKFRWGTFTSYYRGLSLNLIQFSSDHGYKNYWFISFVLWFGQVWIDLPEWIPTSNFGNNDGEDIRKWGFSWGFSADDDPAIITLSWKDKRYYFTLPWGYVHVRSECMMHDGTWRQEPKNMWSDMKETVDYQSEIAYEEHPYYYLTRSGVRQRVVAKIHVRESEWRPKITKRFPLFRRIRRTISVDFNSGIGERVNSWKGGCLGCEFEMKVDETPSQALMRMMETRRF